MSLQLYDTLSRRKRPFEPLRAGHIGIYVCGMTVYDYCHLGHARVLVAFDVVTRWLRARGWDVCYVRNITDVDDKILRRAEENDEPVDALTARFIAAMHEDERRLGVLAPDIEPRATAHIDEIIALIERLLEKGYAYALDNGDVYYRVSRFKNYGKLSGRDPESLLAGARVDVDESKEDPRDFALWKSATSDESHWPSPWGPGRPGWHIECSAMSTQCLGESFDIHGGGPDLRFPHHENEIAQSEAATGKHYARYWMHAGAVRVDGEKMSKSLGNFFTIRDILSQWHPEIVRYLLLGSHYRSAINYSEQSLHTARGALERFYLALRDAPAADVVDVEQLSDPSPAAKRFVEAMDDDFNTPEALAALFDLARELNTALKEGSESLARRLVVELRSLGAVLGLFKSNPLEFLQSGSGAEDSGDNLSREDIDALVSEREAAKKARDYARADAIRAELKQQGVILEDSREGTIWRRE